MNLTALCWTNRLERAVLAVIAEDPASVKTPDLKGTGSTRSFTDAVIKRL